jgi:hypothetical protein
MCSRPSGSACAGESGRRSRSLSPQFAGGEKVASEIRIFFGAMNSARLSEASHASARPAFAPGAGLLDHAVT